MKDTFPLRPPVRLWSKVLIAAAVIGAVAALWFFVLRDALSLAAIQESGGDLRRIAAERPVFSSLAFFGINLLIVIFCLPAVALIMLVGGFIFGTIWGGLLVLAGNSIGAIILFLIARSALGKPLRERARGLYDKVAAGMQQDATSYLLFMRLVPVFPFFFVNIVPALFHIPLRVFAWTTLAGIAPVTFIYAYLGQTLGSVEKLTDLFSPSLALALTLMGILALAPIAVKKLKNRRRPAAGTVPNDGS